MENDEWWNRFLQDDMRNWLRHAGGRLRTRGHGVHIGSTATTRSPPGRHTLFYRRQHCEASYRKVQPGSRAERSRSRRYSSDACRCRECCGSRGSGGGGGSNRGREGIKLNCEHTLTPCLPPAQLTTDPHLYAKRQQLRQALLQRPGLALQHQAHAGAQQLDLPALPPRVLQHQAVNAEQGVPASE